ncbi:MAG TPA: GGDEF domain-containing protein, partial [Chitinivibrionales bacterium]
RLTDKTFRGREAREHWRKIIQHKRDMETKLGRRVGISPAAIDYFEIIGSQSKQNIPSLGEALPHKNGGNEDESESKVFSPTYHLEVLKKEMLRAKRYKHALSAILLDVDNFHTINERYSFKTGDDILSIIVKIIQKTTRVVDIIARYSGDRFLVVLPDTNIREAQELAQRLQLNVAERTKRIEGLDFSGVTATLSVGQMPGSGGSVEFIKHLETILQEGKKKKRNMVYALH